MKNLLGVTGICVKPFILNTANEKSFDEFNAMLNEYDGYIIDIEFIGQALGQVCAMVTFKYTE